ncbi:MAG: hypothetical protein AAGI46_05145 [Planctomycetota bacterium]
MEAHRWCRLRAVSHDQMGRLIETTAVRCFDTATGESSHRTFYQADGMVDYELLVDADGVANGVLTKDYAHDSLGRLEGVRHFLDTDGDAVHDAGEVLLDRSLYTFFADGRRASEDHTDHVGDGYLAEWSYDGLGRLSGETLTSATLGGAFNFSESYGHDLVGNRLVVEREQSGVTTTTTNLHDSLDRLRESTSDAGTPGDASDNTVTTYSYVGPDGDTSQQREKTVTTAGTVTSTTTYGYGVMGRMSEVSVTEGSVTTTATYEYDTSGIRVSRTEGSETVVYHIDPSNPTGYAQVLEEGVDQDVDGEELHASVLPEPVEVERAVRSAGLIASAPARSWLRSVGRAERCAWFALCACPKSSIDACRDGREPSRIGESNALGRFERFRTPSVTTPPDHRRPTPNWPESPPSGKVARNAADRRKALT